MSDPSETSASVSPPSLASVVVALLLAPLSISVALSLIFAPLGLGSLLVSLPACLLAIPLVMAIRKRVAFRLRNAVVVGAIAGLALGLVVKIAVGRLGEEWTSVIVWGVAGAIYSTVAYAFMKAIDNRRDR